MVSIRSAASRSQWSTAYGRTYGWPRSAIWPSGSREHLSQCLCVEPVGLDVPELRSSRAPVGPPVRRDHPVVGGQHRHARITPACSSWWSAKWWAGHVGPLAVGDQVLGEASFKLKGSIVCLNLKQSLASGRYLIMCVMRYASWAPGRSARARSGGREALKNMRARGTV